MAITYFEISYPNFVLGAIIDPEEANQNNHEIVDKINNIVEGINLNEDNIINLGIIKADAIDVDNKFNINSTAISEHKVSTDHDYKYYTKTLLDGGQLDSRYFTETELNKGQLNNIYYTKGQLSPFLAGGTTPIYTDKFIIISPDNGDGTFTYMHDDIEYIGNMFNENSQEFKLTDNTYKMGVGSLLVYIDGVLFTSIEGNKVIELTETTFALTPLQLNGVEIIIRYINKDGIIAVDNVIKQLSDITETNNILKNSINSLKEEVNNRNLPLAVIKYNEVSQWADILIPDETRGKALLEFLLLNEESSLQVTNSEQAMLVIMEEERFDKNRQVPFDYDQIIFKLGQKTETGQYLAWVEELLADYTRGIEKLELGLMFEAGCLEIASNKYAMNIIMQGEQIDGLTDYRRKFADKANTDDEVNRLDAEIQRLDIRIDGVVV